MSAIIRQKKVSLESLYPKLNKQCRLCHKPLKGRQTSWCSKACGWEAWHQIQLRRGSSKDARLLVKRRDNEICANCGRDCALIKRIFDHAGISILKYVWADRSLHPYYMIMRYFGFTPLKHTWESNHIMAVADGGEHILENLETLCIPCHKQVTKQQNEERRNK